MPRCLPTAAALGLLSALGALALLPYVAALQPEVFAELPLPLPVVALLQGVQGLLLFTVLAFVGLRAGEGRLAGAPLLRSRLEQGPAAAVPWGQLGAALALGAAGGLAVVGLDLLFALPAPATPQPPAWTGLLACLYGAVAEEVQLRVFLLSVLVWGAGKLGARGDGAAWGCVAVAAVLFGLGHLPAAFGLWEPSALVVARTLVLNGLLGLPFGWLYWRRGFAHAAAAHLGADLVLHVMVPVMG